MRKVAIVAKGGTSALAPWRDETWEIWGIPWIIYPRVDRLFDIHSSDFWQASENSSKFETEWRSKFNKTETGAVLYADPSRSDALPGSVPYPLDEVAAFLPISYLENSISYMLAFAIMEHAAGDKIESIGLWGVHMRGAPEYADERASVTFLVGLAFGMGIDVHVPPGNPLFMSAWMAGRYGLGGGKRMINPLMGAHGVTTSPKAQAETASGAITTDPINRS